MIEVMAYGFTNTKPHKKTTIGVYSKQQRLSKKRKLQISSTCSHYMIIYYIH